MRNFHVAILTVCLVILCCHPLHAGQTLVIGVEDKDWGGHYRWMHGELVGIDADIVRRTASKLGYDVTFVPYPWKRVLQMAEAKEIDGVLDLAPTQKRKRYLYFVDTPISEETTVLWVKVGSKIWFDGSFNRSMRLGLMRGSDWTNRFGEMGKPTVIYFDSYEAAFNNLAEDRIDAFGGHLAPTREHVINLGYIDKVEAHDYDFTALPYYIAFSGKPGHADLANRFSDALQDFFYGPEYQALLKEYGVVNIEKIFYPPRQ